MPFVCEKTGEMAPAFEHSVVEVETSPKTLVSITIVRATSPQTGVEERWVWKEDRELNNDERVRWAAYVEAHAKPAAPAVGKSSPTPAAA